MTETTNQTNYPTKGALIRAGRALIAATLAAFTASLVNETAVVLEGTAFVAFSGVLTATYLGVDKYIRERLGL